VSAQRLRLGFAFVVLAAVVMLLAGVANAWASVPDGTLDGTVMGNSAPLANINVDVFDNSGYWVGQAFTNASGYWSINLTPGTYKVFYFAAEYNDAHPTASYVSRYYGDGMDFDAATPVVVDSEVTTTVDTVLEPASYISGSVSFGGAPVQGLTVNVYLDGELMAGRDTDSDGNYIIPGLAPGDYVVEFDSYWYNDENGTNLVTEYYENVHVWDDATLVTVSLGVNATGIDAGMEVSGSISGTVTGGGEPLPDVWVNLYDSDGYWVTNALSSAEGTYTLDGFSPGDYRVGFDPNGYNFDHDTMFIEQYWDNAPTLDDATPISVSVGVDVPGIDADLVSAGSVSGTVTGGGNPLANVWVSARQGYWVIANAQTDAGGNYTITWLPPGDYEIEFDPGQYNYSHDTSYLLEYYDNAHYGEARTTVGVDADTTTPDINANLETAGTISGTVTGDGGPVDHLEVQASLVDGSWSNGAYTNPDGSYTITGLPAGDYIVSFDPWLVNPSGPPSFLYQYYEGVDQYEDATPVAVDYGADTPGINAELVVAGSISGIVTGDGGPLAEIDVSAYSESGGYGYASTDADGHYQITGLGAGDYVVEFRAGWYNYANETAFLEEYYSNARLEEDATLVSVTLAGDTGNIDADLEIGATLGGTVTGDGGAILNGVNVTVFDSAGNYVSDDWMEAGSWAVRGVYPGDYVVQFSAWDYNAYNDTSYIAEYWDDKSTFDTATRVTGTYGGQIMDIDAQLVQGGGSIAGTAYGPDGTTPLAGILVYAYDQTPTGETVTLGSDYTDADGTYSVTGLGTGSHYVVFYDESERYKDVVYDGVPEGYGEISPALAMGTPVNVVTGQTTGGIDAVMPAPATLAASVQDAEGNGIEDIAVTLWYNGGAAGWVPVHRHLTERDGSALFDGAYCGLFPGEYRVQFADDHGDLGEAWYLDSASAEEAQTFTVAGGENYTLDPQVLPVVTPPEDVTFTPIEGATRIGTAVAASQKAFPDGASTVIVATGYNWPDALGGSALAGVLDAPLLLTATDALPAAVATEIDRLGATRAIILGKAAAVDAEVEDALKELLGDANVERIGGADRYETSRLIAARCVDEQDGSYDGTAFLATGSNFPDQIAAAPLAAGKGWPIYLTNPLHPGEPNLIAAMQADGVTDVLVLGSTNAVSAPAMQAVTTSVPCTGTRLGGADRYETAKIIATYGVTEAGMSWDGLAITTGTLFPDGLVGGVLQGKTGSVLMLTKPDVLYSGIAMVLTDNKDSIHEVRFFGSTSAVSSTVRAQVAQILQ